MKIDVGQIFLKAIAKALDGGIRKLPDIVYKLFWLYVSGDFFR